MSFGSEKRPPFLFSDGDKGFLSFFHLHRETKGLEGGVSSLVDEGRNYGGGGEFK